MSAMLEQDKGIFVHFAGISHTRVLHPAKIVSSVNAIYTTECEEPGVETESEQDLVVYFDADGKFMQQSGQVQSVFETAPYVVFSFALMGEPASAENRDFFRISTVLYDVTVDVNGDSGCKVVDVGLRGIGMIGPAGYGIGQVLDLRLRFQNGVWRGQGCISDVRRARNGRIRYGLSVVETERNDVELASGLRFLTMELQRQQLRRLAYSN